MVAMFVVRVSRASKQGEREGSVIGITTPQDHLMQVQVKVINDGDEGDDDDGDGSGGDHHHRGGERRPRVRVGAKGVALC